MVRRAFVVDKLDEARAAAAGGTRRDKMRLDEVQQDAMLRWTFLVLGPAIAGYGFVLQQHNEVLRAIVQASGFGGN